MGRNTKFDSRSTLESITSSQIPQGDDNLSKIDDGTRDQTDDDHLTRGLKVSIQRYREEPVKLPQIMIGHSSHILLAGAGPKSKARELPTTGGIFTNALLNVLRESKALEQMTYRHLVEEVNHKMGDMIKKWNKENKERKM
jgi:hypothetical protein